MAGQGSGAFLGTASASEGRSPRPRGPTRRRRQSLRAVSRARPHPNGGCRVTEVLQRPGRDGPAPTDSLRLYPCPHPRPNGGPPERPLTSPMPGRMLSGPAVAKMSIVQRFAGPASCEARSPPRPLAPLTFRFLAGASSDRLPLTDPGTAPAHPTPHQAPGARGPRRRIKLSSHEPRGPCPRPRRPLATGGSR